MRAPVAFATQHRAGIEGAGGLLMWRVLDIGMRCGDRRHRAELLFRPV